MANSSASELEKLISNCEFENYQYVKLIEHEDQQIEALQKEIDFKEEETRRLQEAISQLEVDTKQCHKQYNINKDNIESLKKTNDVLTEHVAAMDSKMEIIDAKIQAEKQENSQHLQRYKDIWDTYFIQYESLPLAQELKKQTMMTEDISKKNLDKEQFIQSAKQKQQLMQGYSELCNMGINEFIVALAKMRIGTMQTIQEVERSTIELTQLQQNLQQNMQAASERNNETNVQKLTDMHLVDQENSEVKEATVESSGQLNQTDIESPMISMLCERDDETEAMQTDVVSLDQVNLQFVEEQVPNQPCETLANQISDSTGGSYEQTSVASRDDEMTVNAEADSGSCQSYGTGYLMEEDGNAQCAVSTHETEQHITDTGYIQAGVATSSQFSTDPNCGQRTQQPELAGQAQLPFVTYKAKGPESVHIHIDKPADSDQQVRKQPQETDMCNQSLPKNLNQITIPRPNTMLAYERPNNRTQIPQVRPITSLRPSYLETRPVVIPVRPPTIQQQFNRTIGNLTHASSLRKPVLPNIIKPVHTVQRPHIYLPRQAGVSSRLPVLQTPRPSVLHTHQSLVSLPNRIHGAPVGSNSSQLAAASAAAASAASSPVQLTTPPINYQSPSERQQSPNQLPAQSHQIQQHRASPLTYSPAKYSTESIGMQYKPVVQNHLTQRHVSPPKIGQRYAPKRPSPIAQHLEKYPPTKMTPVVVQQTLAGVAVPRPTVSVQGKEMVGTEIDTAALRNSPLVDMENSRPDVYRMPQVGMEFDHVDLRSNSKVGMEFDQADVHNSSQVGIEITQAGGQSYPQVDMEIAQPDGGDTYYVKVKETSKESKTDPATSSPQNASAEPVKTPEKDKIRSLAEETFSPFDSEKHRQMLADMKKSPGQPDNLYSFPVKRVFAEMEGSTCDQEPDGQTMQLPVFGQTGLNNTTVMPFDGSGDHTNTGQTEETKFDESSSLLHTDAESAFQFFESFESFTKQKGDSAPTSPGNLFCFGGGDMSKTEMQTSQPFSIFASSNDDDMSSAFSFGFGNSTNKPEAESTSGGGSFLSLFGNAGNDDQDNSNSGFTFNFGKPKSPAFSFF